MKLLWLSICCFGLLLAVVHGGVLRGEEERVHALDSRLDSSPGSERQGNDGDADSGDEVDWDEDPEDFPFGA